MLEVKIPEDIRKHENKMFFGFSSRQLITFIISAGVGIIVYFIIKNAQLAGLIAIACSILGFSSIDQRLKPFASFLMKPRTYYYIKTLEYYSYLLDREVESAIQERANEESKANSKSKR